MNPRAPWWRRWLGLGSPSTTSFPMYQPDQVRLFIKPYCGWCRQAMDWLDRHRIRYELLDVIGNTTAYDEMVRLSGQNLAPVIQVDGQLLADFGPAELEAFWRKLRRPDKPS